MEFLLFCFGNILGFVFGICMTTQLWQDRLKNGKPIEISGEVFIAKKIDIVDRE
jgi:hypothetical protein